MSRMIETAGICSLLLLGCSTQAETIQDQYSEQAIAAFMDDAHCQAELRAGRASDYRGCRLAEQKVRIARGDFFDLFH